MGITLYKRLATGSQGEAAASITYLKAAAGTKYYKILPPVILSTAAIYE